MTVLLPPPKPTAAQPSILLRNKTGVANLVKAKAPALVKHDAEWWAAWLKANW